MNGHDCDMPLLTIVVPAWNRAATLQRTLDSIGAQTLRPLAVVLVDDGSRDTTPQIMEAWRDKAAAPDFSVEVIKASHGGAARARNIGFERVTTPFVMFFDSDDVMASNHVADFADAIKANPDTEIFGRQIDMTLLDGSTKKGYFRDRRPIYNHIFHGILSTQRVVVSSNLIRKAGGWDNRAWGWNDFELGLRLLLLDREIKTVSPIPSVVTYMQAESITGTSFSCSPAKWEDTLRYCDDDIYRLAAQDEVTALKLLVDIKRLVLAAHYRREGARSEARRLRREIFSRHAWPTTFRLQAIYAAVRLTGRGAPIATRFLFPKISNR